MVVHSLRKVLAAVAVLAGLAVVIGVPAATAVQGGTTSAAIFQAPYAQP